MASRTCDLVVVGGGVAALTAALYGAELGLDTVVVCDMLVGGQILNIDHVTRYPGFLEPPMGGDLAAVVEQQAAAGGAKFVFDEVLAITPGDGHHSVSTSDTELHAPAVILATGSRLRALGIPGEERLQGRGVSYCGSCDGPLFAGRTVAVIGGGDSAVDEALVVADHAEHTLVLVRDAAIHAAATTTARMLSHPAITVELGVELEEILGGDTVSGLRIRGRDGQGSTDLAVDGVFIYAGLDPNTELVCDLLDLDDEGRVPTDAWMETSIPGLFAAGDLRRDSPGQLVNVASDGATAAIAAHQRVASNALAG